MLSQSVIGKVKLQKAIVHIFQLDYFSLKDSIYFHSNYHLVLHMPIFICFTSDANSQIGFFFNICLPPFAFALM